MPQRQYVPCDPAEARVQAETLACWNGSQWKRRGLCFLGCLIILVVGLFCRMQQHSRAPKWLRKTPSEMLDAERVWGGKLVLKFPMSFEDHGYLARCPVSWTCQGDAKVCRNPPLSQRCNHPGLSGLDGNQYLSLGDDLSTGSATSIAFFLPHNIDRIDLKRSGGADSGSGFYLHLLKDNSVICSSEDSLDTNIFVDDSCMGLNAYAGQTVYINVTDSQKTIWGKVLIDDIRLIDNLGNYINETVGVLSPLRL